MNDHDLLIRIDEKLTKALHEINDLDRRIVVLEKDHWKIVGGFAVFVILGDAVIKWLFR